MASDATVQQVVAQVARELDGQVPALTAELAALFLERIPAFQGDEAVRELMAASTSSNLSTIFDVLLHGLPLDRIDVPAAAAAYARRFAQRDLPVEDLLRAYRLGQERLTQWILRCLGARSLDAVVLLACTQEVVSVLSRYIDQISEHLIEIYDTERKLWTQRTDAARAVALRTVLDDETLDLSTAEAMIGYRLRGWHVAAVAWVEIDTPNAARWVESAVGVLTAAHGARPLSVLLDDHTLWAWVSSPSSMRLADTAVAAALETAPAPASARPAISRSGLTATPRSGLTATPRSGLTATPRSGLTATPRSGLTATPQSGPDVGSPLRIALGEPAAGLTGFRSSHREALRAKMVAETSGEPLVPVISFSRVSMAAMLSEDLDALRAWVARTLGELARDDEGMARLRETVRVFLETGGSFTDAAARLHLHKNTVHYRVRKAEEIRGRPLGEGRLEVEVALVACQQLGRRVLGPP